MMKSDVKRYKRPPSESIEQYSTMKYLVVLSFLVAAQAELQGLYHVQMTMSEIEGAPKYNNGGRIINGIPAYYGQFPHQAGLYLDGRGFCGGSLISRRMVLTAAHCADGISIFSVHLGALIRSEIYNEPGRLIITTLKKIVHMGYNQQTLNNDVALVDLGFEVPLTPYINVINIAAGSNNFEGLMARVSGWGRTFDGNSGGSDELNYVDVIVISNDVCKRTFGSSTIVASTLCTLGSGTKGVCNGDSGSPLIEPSTMTQIGIASFVSSMGCESGAPNGFARVSSFAIWIEANTRNAIQNETGIQYTQFV